MVRVSKAAWIWLIIPVINIPLGIGIFIFAKSQMASMSAAAERKQAELVARTEQLEREKAEAEARANEQDEPEEHEETPKPRPPRPPASPGKEDEESEAPTLSALNLTITCNNVSCEGLEKQTGAVTVHISSDAELSVPVDWTNAGSNTIRRRFSPPVRSDNQPILPLEVEIKSVDGRSKKVTFPIDLWFNIAYDNSN